MVGRQALFILGLTAGILLPGISSGWLEEGSANYGEVASWFSDPIFYSGPNRGGHEEYYPYFGENFFTSGYDRSPPGVQAIEAQRRVFESPFLPYFGEQFLYARSTSSFRIFREGTWSAA